MEERLVEMEAASEAARRRLVKAEAATAAAEAARLAEGAAAAAEKLRLGQERERERALMAQRITMLQQRVRDRQEAVRCARDQMTRLSAIWERTRLGQQVGHAPLRPFRACWGALRVVRQGGTMKVSLQAM